VQARLFQSVERAVAEADLGEVHFGPLDHAGRQLQDIRCQDRRAEG
jgi:hypothetical protein